MSLITFNDICIDSQYSEVDSRSKVDISANIGKVRINFPVVSANMPDITEYKMAVEMFSNGGLGIIHRFMSVDENVNQFKMAIDAMALSEREKEHLSYFCGVSIGVKDNEKERFEKLYEAGARLFCIDIAHGHSVMMKNMLQWVKKHNNVCVIAGNIATARSALDLCEWGADILKVGIGPGMVCRTRSNTGVGKPQFSALMEVYNAVHGITGASIISDGGIKTAGDIAKALIFADAVMVGAVLAGTVETPGNVYPEPGTDLTNRQYYKMYGGSASAENKARNGQNGRFVEGEMRRIPFKGHAKYLLREIQDGLRSSLSYTGVSNLRDYKEKVKWELISGSGKVESKL